MMLDRFVTHADIVILHLAVVDLLKFLLNSLTNIVQILLGSVVRPEPWRNEMLLSDECR